MPISPRSRLEITFSRKWRSLYPDIILTSEFTFAKPRRFRFDFAHLGTKVAIEIQGGTYLKGKRTGRHNRGADLAKEYEKLNIAALNGWRVFFLDSKMVRKLENYQAIAQSIRDSGRSELVG